MSGPVTHTYDVPGISCDHCVKSIVDKVTPIEGVDDIAVDLDTKSVTVVGGNEDEIAGAIVAAGYEIV